MNQMVNPLILAVLTVTVLLAGCNGDGEQETGRETGVDVTDRNAANGFDMDDVPSLNLPADQREPGRLWCKEHNRYEDECYICHPELKPDETTTLDADDVPSLNLPADQRELGRLWCKEHDRYEDECYICHPELKPNAATTLHVDDVSSLNSPADQREPGGLWCNEHNVAEAECGICQPDQLAGLSVGEGMKVRFASSQSVSKAGVKTGHPIESSSSAALEVLGQISFNRNELAMVAPLGGGVIAEVLKDVGDTVAVGEVLAVVHSREIADARGEYHKALAESELARLTLAREEKLHREKISARQDFEHARASLAVAEAAVSKSRQNLHNLGLSEEEIQASSGVQKDMSSLPVRAPFTGTVIERTAVLGTAVEAGARLFAVADLSTMWMELSIPESQLSSIRVGSLIRARFDAYPGISFEGEVTWIAPTVNPDTRMLQARAVLANPQSLLKEGLFGRASLAGYVERSGISVPTEAIQNVDGKAVVFRKLQDDLYETRLVETGAARDGNVIVLAGIAQDDEIVTEGSYIVKSEFLKARLGAGCTDD